MSNLTLDVHTADGSTNGTFELPSSVFDVEVSTPLLEDPPPVRPYSPGSWGPNSIHQLIAPNAWRLPFERSWRD